MSEKLPLRISGASSCTKKGREFLERLQTKMGRGGCWRVEDGIIPDELEMSDLPDGVQVEPGSHSCIVFSIEVETVD